MSKDTNRRREMRQLLALRKEKGLTYQELSEHSGIPKGTLVWWSHQLRNEGTDDDAFVDLGVVDLAGSASSSEGGPDVRLLHPSGLIIELHGELADQVVASVLRDVLGWS